MFQTELFELLNYFLFPAALNLPQEANDRQKVSIVWQYGNVLNVNINVQWNPLY